jgi:RNA polymerase sigma factor
VKFAIGKLWCYTIARRSYRGGAFLKEIDHMAAEAAADKRKLDRFIEQHETYIIKCASKAARRYLTKSDDEWAMAQLAFAEAVRSYDLEKGSFYSFAELVIRRKLIDYYRAESKYNMEQAVDPAIFSAEPGDDDEDDYSVRRAVANQAQGDEGESLKLEIEAANALFKEYGFSFFELADCSPKSRKTRQSCALAVNYLLSNPLLVNELRGSKKLLINLIEKNCGIPRKILERHRKYIIAATEILCGDYPYLAEYLKFIRKEADR